MFVINITYLKQLNMPYVQKVHYTIKFFFLVCIYSHKCIIIIVPNENTRIYTLLIKETDRKLPFLQVITNIYVRVIIISIWEKCHTTQMHLLK